MGLVLSLCRFLSSQLRRFLVADSKPKLEAGAAPATACQPEPVTALPLFGEMVLYAYANGDVVGIDAERRVLLRDSMSKDIFQPSPPASAPVARFASAISQQGFLEECLQPAAPRPAVLESWATKGWKALGKWDFDFFSTTCGDMKVEVTLPKGQREFQPLRSYLQSLKAKQSCGQQLPYLRGWYYEKDAPWLADDLWQKGDFHEVFQDWFKRFPARHHPDFHWLFIGGAGAVTPLHIDPSTTHAWLTQISGRKRFTLFPPCDIPKLLSKDPDRIFRPLSELKAAASVQQLEVVLHPGETIFVPAHWPHEVECLDDSISVTWNFLGRSNFALVRAAYLANCANS